MISIDEAPAVTSTRAAEIRNLVRFAITGGAAAVCNVASRMLLSKQMRYGVAVSFAYVVGMIVAFVLARALVFGASDQPWRKELAKFATVNIASFSQVWLVSVALAQAVFPHIHFRWHADSVAHIIGVSSPLLFSYYAHKYFTFRRSNEIPL